VVHKDDTAVTRHAYAVFPVQGAVREEFSPLLYPLFANYVASYVAARLGRSLFQSDRPSRIAPVGGGVLRQPATRRSALGELVAFIPLTQERPLYRRSSLSRLCLLSPPA